MFRLVKWKVFSGDSYDACLVSQEEPEYALQVSNHDQSCPSTQSVSKRFSFIAYDMTFFAKPFNMPWAPKEQQVVGVMVMGGNKKEAEWCRLGSSKWLTF